jgi:hypothetical protein
MQRSSKFWLGLWVSVAAEAALTVWSQRLTYAGTPLADSTDALLAWVIIVIALAAVVAIRGVKHERIWLVGGV